jgi:hypothetical protein
VAAMVLVSEAGRGLVGPYPAIPPAEQMLAVRVRVPALRGQRPDGLRDNLLLLLLGLHTLLHGVPLLHGTGGSGQRNPPGRDFRLSRPPPLRFPLDLGLNLRLALREVGLFLHRRGLLPQLVKLGLGHALLLGASTDYTDGADGKRLADESHRTLEAQCVRAIGRSYFRAGLSGRYAAP